MENLNIEQFNPTLAELTWLADKYRWLKINGVDDKHWYEIVKSARLDLKEKRVAITKTGKQMREQAIVFQKAVISKEKELVAIIEEVEKDLQAQEDAVNLEKDMIKRRKDLPERVDRLIAVETEMLENDILRMDDKQFDLFVAQKKEEMVERQRIANEAEKKKLDDERLELQRKQDLIDAEERGRQKAMEEIKQPVVTVPEVVSPVEVSKPTVIKYKREWNGKMSPEDFEQANTQYFQDKRMEDHPELAYMINDGNLDKYYSDIDWKDIIETMVELYRDFLDF